MSTKTPELASVKATNATSVAHSPDSDDAFMFYGLATNKIRVPGYRFNHTLSDIETLQTACREEAFYDVTAISFHAYPYLQNNYTLMGCGGSVGEGYGPMVVSSHMLDVNDLRRIRVAASGRHAALTAYPCAQNLPTLRFRRSPSPLTRIIPEILAGKYDAGLIIHEGQLTYSTSVFSG